MKKILMILMVLLLTAGCSHDSTAYDCTTEYGTLTEGLNRCNSEYQKLVDYHKNKGIRNPFIECVGYAERDTCFEQTMEICVGDV